MKDFFKKLLVPILSSRHIANVAEYFFENQIPVFMLHRMARNDSPVPGRTDPDHLRNCLGYLKEHGYSFISLEQLIVSIQNKMALPPKPVVFTMDDGYLDQAEVAAPIFLEYDCPLTFFVITGMLDGSNWPWDAKTSWLIESASDAALESSGTLKRLHADINVGEDKRIIRRSVQDALKKLDADEIPAILQQLADEIGLTIPDSAPPAYQAMSWDMARQLEQQGIRFAPHSVKHNILSKLDHESARGEIERSWQTIDNELDNPLKVFCYPNGRMDDFSSREINILKNNGFLGAVSVTPDYVDPKDNNAGDRLYMLPRIALPDNMIDFIQYCSWIEGAKGLRHKI